MPKIAGRTRITARYERLFCDDDLVGESNSITNQKKYLDDYAHRDCLKNIRHFTDDEYFGVNFQRPGVQALIAAIEAGKVETISVKDLSKFGRNYLDVGFIWKSFSRKRTCALSLSITALTAITPPTMTLLRSSIS